MTSGDLNIYPNEKITIAFAMVLHELSSAFCFSPRPSRSRDGGEGGVENPLRMVENPEPHQGDG